MSSLLKKSKNLSGPQNCPIGVARVWCLMCSLESFQSASHQLAVLTNAVADYRFVRKGGEFIHLQSNPHQQPLLIIFPLQLMRSAAFLTDCKARSISSN